MRSKEIEILISKKLSGEASAKELSELRIWQNANAQNREEIRNITLALQLSKGKFSTERKPAVLVKIWQKIETEEKQKIVNTSRYAKVNLKRWLSIAATLIVLVSVATYYFTSIPSDVPIVLEKSEMAVKSNPAGQKSKVFLPDGSIVWLNSESSITYEKEFNSQFRRVNLQGEAYFEVNKDAERPFVVFTGSLSTTALGTAFNIHAFNEENITVSLTSGRVNVETINIEGENTGFIINAGEGVVYNAAAESKIDLIKIDTDKVKMWKDGLLELKDASLAQTIEELERWYGVDIVCVNEPIKNWNANGLFDNEYLDNVLRSLSFSQNFEYEIIGKNVNVTFK
jgi:ferric-dicitrate binding protein FerR (iron transport regulator)